MYVCLCEMNDIEAQGLWCCSGKMQAVSIFGSCLYSYQGGLLRSTPKYPSSVHSSSQPSSPVITYVQSRRWPCFWYHNTPRVDTTTLTGNVVNYTECLRDTLAWQVQETSDLLLPRGFDATVQELVIDQHILHALRTYIHEHNGAASKSRKRERGGWEWKPRQTQGGRRESTGRQVTFYWIRTHTHTRIFNNNNVNSNERFQETLLIFVYTAGGWKHIHTYQVLKKIKYGDLVLGEEK